MLFCEVLWLIFHRFGFGYTLINYLIGISLLLYFPRRIHILTINSIVEDSREVKQ